MNELPNADWRPCPDGELSRLRALLRRRRMRRRFLQSAGVAALGSVAILAGYGLREPEPPAVDSDVVQRLSCAEVISLAGDYRAGTLPKPKRRGVDDHLGHCNGCHRKYRELGLIS